MIEGKFKIKGEWAAHTGLDAEVVSVGNDDDFVLDVAGSGQLAFLIWDFEDGELLGASLKKGMKAKVFIFLDANVEDSFKQ